MTEPVNQYVTSAAVLAGVPLRLPLPCRRAANFTLSKVNGGSGARDRGSITEPGGDHRALTQVSAGRIALKGV